MQLIAVDIGNSSTKLAAVCADNDDQWVSQQVLRGDEQVCVNSLGVDASSPCFWSVSSVNQHRLEHLADWVHKNRSRDKFHAIAADDVELKTNLESREQLGRDRLVAAWMAVELDRHSRPLVVVDAGTAVTIDYIDADKVFQGGVIYPGAESNFRQLAQHTDALPDLSSKIRQHPKADDVIGKSTKDAIFKVVFHSQAWAICGIVKQLQTLSKQTTPVYLTGGGIADLDSFFPGKWNSVPDLVLRGAKEIGMKLVKQL